MIYTNLKDSPGFYKQTLDLIEKSFNYSRDHSFEIDFYSLMQLSNRENAHIIVENDQVIAHIATLDQHFSINGKTFPIRMYGGISVSESYRGRGLFKTLFNHLFKNEDVSMHFLWSDKIELYQKYFFHPCIEMYEYEKNKVMNKHKYQIIKKRISDLSDTELQMITNFYNKIHEYRIARDDQYWKMIKNFESIDIHLIYFDNKLINYFLKNKGEDLTDIIHEYGLIDEHFLNIFLNYGKVWTPFLNNKNHPLSLFSSLCRIGDEKMFTSLISEITPFKNVLINDQNISFKFEDKLYSESTPDFLNGVFGPGRYKEITSLPFYICGLDSI